MSCEDYEESWLDRLEEDLVVYLCERTGESRERIEHYLSIQSEFWDAHQEACDYLDAEDDD